MKNKKMKSLKSADDLFDHFNIEPDNQQILDSNNNMNSNLDINHTIKIPTDVCETENNSKSKINLTARAPYNFIPLNEFVIKADVNKSDIDLSRYKRNTGYIEIAITNKTPLYIRDSVSLEESNEINSIEKKLKELRKGSQEFVNEFKNKLNILKNYFSPANGNFRIPGSSLRGLIRNFVEISSWSRFGTTDKSRKFHYRSFMDRSLDLRDEFKEKILCEINEIVSGKEKLLGYSQQVKAGYLIRSGNTYKIKPADYSKNNCWFFRVEEEDVIGSGILVEKMSKAKSPTDARLEKNPKYKIGITKVKFLANPPSTHNHSQKLYYANVTNIYKFDDSSAPAICLEGYLIHSGWMPGKIGRLGKHLHWVIGPSLNEELDFLPDVIENYKNDINRDENINLLEWFKKYDTSQVPCFYISEEVIENGKTEEKIKSFGHTGIFRIAYENSIKSFIPQNHFDGETLDIATSMFGNETEFSTRVFFEDAFCLSDSTAQEEKFPDILSSPKPTTFQHYLVQKGIEPVYNPNTKKLQGFKNLRDYNSNDISIRGNKIYWHRSSASAFKDENRISNKDISQYTKIKPIQEEKSFHGRIRFENLSDVELGALLFALDLPDGCCHKIGMGKPLGLGSIRIESSLHLSNRENRYKDLFAEWTDTIPESEKDKVKDLKDKFADYVIKQLKGVNNKQYTSENLWEEDRMKELLEMLNYEKGMNKTETNYMKIQPINEFKNRPVLPQPSDVK